MKGELVAHGEAGLKIAVVTYARTQVCVWVGVQQRLVCVECDWLLTLRHVSLAAGGEVACDEEAEPVRPLPSTLQLCCCDLHSKPAAFQRACCALTSRAPRLSKEQTVNGFMNVRVDRQVRVCACECIRGM